MRLDVTHCVLLAILDGSGRPSEPVTEAVMAADLSELPIFISQAGSGPLAGLPAGVRRFTRTGPDPWPGDLSDHLRTIQRDQLVVIADRFNGSATLAVLGALMEAWEVWLLADAWPEGWSQDIHIQRLLHAGASPITLAQAKLEWSLPPLPPLEAAGDLFG